MKTKLSFFVLGLFMVVLIAAYSGSPGGPDDTINKRLRFTSGWTSVNSNVTAPKWKDWAGTWYASDTTEAYNINYQNFRDDTLIMPYVFTTATSGYCAAVKVQFGVNGVWKAPYTIDSLFQYGGALADGVETEGDSAFVSKPIYWLIKGTYAGASQFRMIVAKDTTDAADLNAGTTNSTTTTFGAGVIDP